MKFVVVTYCSRKKNGADVPFLPAFERYAGRHCNVAYTHALSNQRELFFLSGLYGLIAHDTPISNYDYQLTSIEPAFITKVANQIIAANITDIWYLSEQTAKVAPYDRVMKSAAQRLTEKGSGFRFFEQNIELIGVL